MNRDQRLLYRKQLNEATDAFILEYIDLCKNKINYQTELISLALEILMERKQNALSS